MTRSLVTQASLNLSQLVGFRGRDAIPVYWEHAHKDLKQALDRAGSHFFDDTFPVSHAEKQVLQELLDQTVGKEGLRLRIIRAVRIENSVVWGRYQKFAAKIARKRGKCKFGGRGAPLTAAAFEEVAGLDEFTQDLDPELCEAYLWHGTKPQVALKIEQHGFEVDRASAAGKRFGAGGYFAEDPALADKYAGAGEGLYSGCYAMLLCRVALGAQYHVREFKDESAAQKAGRRYDSTLAEPRGASWREFIALNSGQVYPEYALVYERQTPDQIAHDELFHDDLSRAGSEESDDAVYPHYWFHGHTNCGIFHDTYPAETMEPIIQALMDCSWAHRFTYSRKGSDGSHLEAEDPHGDMPEGLRVLKVLRIEDSHLWQEYFAMQEAIRENRDPGSDDDDDGDDDLERVEGVKTVDGLPEPERRRLEQGVNEVYLWHGSSPAMVTRLALQGFPAALHDFNTGMFGMGAYFVEDASHADEFSEDDKDGYYKGYYAMMLCRVTLGKAQVLPKPDLNAHERTGRGREFDSSVGHVTASSGSFREFVVPERAQIYPEYAIIYERRYRRARVR